MCGPWALPLALVAAGTTAQYFGNKQAQRAQERTYQNERKRQESMSAEQQALFDQSLDTTGKIKDPEAEGAAVANRRQAFIEALNTRDPSQDYLPGQGSGPQVVADVASDISADQRGRSEANADALANLTGFGDQIFKTGISVGRNSQQIGQIGGNKRNSAAVLDAEMRAAAQKGSFLRGLGGLASSIGAAMIPGAAGLGGAAGTAAGAGGGIVMNGQAVSDAFRGAFGRSGVPLIPVS